MKELNLEEILVRTHQWKEKKVWYVAIIGRPNVWKSTFINALIWEKVSIISNIPQTTRKRVLAIYNDSDSQIIFFDTPWVHKNEKEFNQKINHEAIKSMREADLVLYFIDSSRPYWDEESQIEEILEFINSPIVKVYTKLDLASKIEIPLTNETIKISSPTKTGFEELLTKVKSYLHIWNPYYPEDYYTDQDIYFRISEIVREKVFLNTTEEIPHSTYIEIEEIQEEESLLKIQAYIYTETDSQRYIIVGKSGNLITKIGTEARIELEEIFWKKVFISLRVKTMEKWRRNDKIIKNILK